MWGGPGCDGTWVGGPDGWSENWNQWGWADGPKNPYGNSWPPGPPGPPGPGVPQKAAPIANIPPIKDVASLVSPRLFTGASADKQGTVTNGGTGPAASSQSSLDSAALLAYQQMQQQEYGDDGPFGGLPMADDISTEVKNLVTRFDIRDKKIELRLIEALKHRGDRWVADIQDYRSCLSRARNPAGFLIVKLSDMEKAINAEQGTTIGAARELCANYRRGHCNRGDSCKYSHDVQVGLSKATNVANLIAEAQKSAANLGFSGGFSSAAPPALPSAPGPLSSPMPSPSPPMSMPVSMPSVERSERQELRESIRSPRKASRSARRSPSRPRVPRSRSRDRARDSRARSRNHRGRDSRDRRPRARDSRSRGRRR
ncbi:unnamed protein product [Cladocopium goreaui]|uniref:C3H1-type domain-containing protein n=1 Tax=Cladocopium goreaui TaxID=2562237 RepID=A0A9P1BPM6_9DINO|nr:unnamed protein product [Cladocopium goreaui]